MSCFKGGSVPRVKIPKLKCNVCKTTKPIEIADNLDGNEKVFRHIAGHAHAVCGIAPPKHMSKSLNIACRAALCAYYVNKGIDQNLAREASGHTGVLGFAHSTERTLTKGDLKHHPLRLSNSNENENEDTIYKSPAFMTFCMTLGMTRDQVMTLWSWQPLFLPLLHIRGRCGLCKEDAPNTSVNDKGVANSSRFVHTKSKVHMDYCLGEAIEIDKRMKFKVPVDVKCFILSYFLGFDLKYFHN